MVLAAMMAVNGSGTGGGTAKSIGRRGEDEMSDRDSLGGGVGTA